MADVPAYTTSDKGQGKHILIFGAGMVVKPAVHYLSGHGYKVTVASRTLERVQSLCEGAKNATAVQCDVTTEEGIKKLDTLIPSADGVVSMLPYIYHPLVAKKALEYNKHFFTTSYVSDAMRALNDEATKKNLTFINECGVDPGTDHMSAMQIIDQVRGKGGKIIGFSSYCGGLPAPADNNNPLGYKFSWAPRGVLLASRNSAKFRALGKEVNIDGEVLFDNYETEQIPELGISFERYPNRNSMQYVDLYGLKLDELERMVRGTYRNRGWCRTVKKFVELGFLDLTERPFTTSDSFARLIKDKVGFQGEVTDKDGLIAATKTFLKLSIMDVDAMVIKNFTWLGLFDDAVKVPAGSETTLDGLCFLMQTKMGYAPGERDMLLMRHEIDAEYADGKKETITCTLIDYGVKNGDTSMARTVTLPVAIAIRLVMEGKFTKVGLHIPTIPELYNPILEELAVLGIKFVHGKK